jgi:superfamily II DNA or RNA helicase
MNRLTAYQADIVSECLEKGSGCLVVPMGTGKTVISLVLSQKLAGKGKTLIIVGKTLIQSWIIRLKNSSAQD